MTDRKAKNAEIFSDTERRYKTESALVEAMHLVRLYLMAGDILSDGG